MLSNNTDIPTFVLFSVERAKKIILHSSNGPIDSASSSFVSRVCLVGTNADVDDNVKNY